MTDFSLGDEFRNYGIKRQTDVRNLTENLCVIFSFVMLAAVLLFYAWVRNRLVTLGYEEQNLQKREQVLTRSQQSLILEEEVLKSPDRIDAIARNELGMIPIRAN